jgi:hypothetical protein
LVEGWGKVLSLLFRGGGPRSAEFGIVVDGPFADLCEEEFCGFSEEEEGGCECSEE